MGIMVLGSVAGVPMQRGLMRGVAGTWCGTPHCPPWGDSREGSLQAAPLGPDHLSQCHKCLSQEVLHPNTAP